MIEHSGNMRNFWEGENESYNQNVKIEISAMKHNEKYLNHSDKNLEDRCLGFLR